MVKGWGGFVDIPSSSASGDKKGKKRGKNVLPIRKKKLVIISLFLKIDVFIFVPLK